MLPKDEQQHFLPFTTPRCRTVKASSPNWERDAGSNTRSGIRIENELLCVPGETTEYGEFRHFEAITYCPYELDAVIPEMLTEYEKKTLNDYHAMVRETLKPYLTEEENAWLANETRAI